MEQLKSYLSKQRNIGNVLILGNRQCVQALGTYLMNACRAAHVFETAEDDVVILRRLIIDCQIDTILFGKGYADIVKEIGKSSDTGNLSIRYLAGEIRMSEEYFNLWVQYREQAEYIYIAREREGECGRDVDRHEVLEWSRTKSPIELSVIIPVYNVKGYLGRCIESLTAWQAPYVEYLFVDDGSTDGSSELIASYAEKDRRIRHIGKENGGCASARNLGLRKAAGKYVGFVDADDFVDEQMFRKLLSRAMMGNYELAYCGYQEYYEESGTAVKVLNDCMTEPYLTGTYRADQVQRLMIRTRVAIWRCIYRRDLLERAHIAFHEELPRFDDLPFKIESGFGAESAVCVPEYLYYYRLDRPGQDVSCSDERLFVHFDIFRILDDAVMLLKNQRLIDYLQIVKLHTHGYALGKIDREYYRKYRKMARNQMDRTVGKIRTIWLMLLYGGRKNILWYLF